MNDKSDSDPSDPRGSGRSHRENTVELVERELEMRVLQDLLLRVEGGRGHVVLVAGEAGIGKTSLLQTLAERRNDAVLWWGACDALQVPHPLAPLHDIARSAEVGFRALLSADDSRAALFEGVLTELQRSRRPTLVVIEDVHWADEATLDWLKFVARRIDRAPCLLVVSFRDDQLTAAHPLRRLLGSLPPGLVTRIDVARLSSAAVDLLARRAFRSPEGIHATTHGNPLFVTELLRHGGKAVPRAVQDLVLARYAELDADAQALVRLASVVPAKIERWLVDHLLGAEVASIDACLSSGLLTTYDASHFAFRHELARLAIESSLSEPVARGLHADVLSALLLVAAPGKASLARLVHHAAHAGDGAAVLRYAPQAAREAEQRGAHREATLLFGFALSHLGAAAHAEDTERTAAWLDAYARGSERADQLDAYIGGRTRLADVHRLAGNVEGEGHNLCKLAMAQAMALRHREALAANRRAIRLLETLPAGPSLANAYRAEAHLHMLERDCGQSVQWGRKAIALADHLGDRRTMLAALSTQGIATMFSDFDAGRAMVLRAVDLATADGLHFVVANAYTNLGATACELLRLDDAQHDLTQALAFAEAHEYDMYESRYLSWLALCKVSQGDWNGGAAAALEVLERPGWDANRIVALVALGRVRARRGEPRAVEVLDEALTLAQVSGALPHVAPVRAARAEAAFLRGDLQAVVDEAGAALPLAVTRGHAWFAGELAYWLHCAGTLTAVPLTCAAPFALQIAGRWAEAAAAWAALGCPFEQARALAKGDGDAPLQAWKQFVSMGAKPAADALYEQLRKAGRRRDLPRVARPATQANPFQLTTREVEVLSLLCGGLKNAAIAERLVRSVRTVDHHLAAIYAKLGVTTRSEAVAAALQAGIASKE